MDDLPWYEQWEDTWDTVPCIYCPYMIEMYTPGHEFVVIDDIGNTLHFHEECFLADQLKQRLEVSG